MKRNQSFDLSDFPPSTPISISIDTEALRKITLLSEGTGVPIDRIINLILTRVFPE
jgi:antitoxin component of RelBE/YafQ-DinJ toxin-antitoxin module